MKDLFNKEKLKKLAQQAAGDVTKVAEGVKAKANDPKLKAQIEAGKILADAAAAAAKGKTAEAINKASAHIPAEVKAQMAATTTQIKTTADQGIEDVKAFIAKPEVAEILTTVKEDILGQKTPVMSAQDLEVLAQHVMSGEADQDMILGVNGKLVVDTILAIDLAHENTEENRAKTKPLWEMAKTLKAQGADFSGVGFNEYVKAGKPNAAGMILAHGLDHPKNVDQSLLKKPVTPQAQAGIAKL